MDTAHKPERKSDVEKWIKKNRNSYPSRSSKWYALDDLLEDYRLHADTGTPLSETVQER